MSEAKKLAAAQQLGDRINEILENPFAGKGLSPEEEATARLIALGKTQEQVALELNLSRTGVAKRMAKVCQILNCFSRDLPTMLVKMIENAANETR